MACLSGLDPTDCAIEHWCPPLDARAEKVGWRAPCPVCRTLRALSVQVKSRRIVWNHHCDCDRKVITKMLRTAVPCAATTRQTKGPGPNLDELWDILRDRSLPPTAMRIAGMRVLGASNEEIMRELEIPRSTYYRAVSILGQKPRSAQSQKRDTSQTQTSLSNETKPQVTGLHKAA